MNLINGAKRAAFLRYLKATGEEILVDGRPTNAKIGDEDSVPEIGADGDPMSGITLSVLVDAESFPPDVLSYGVPLHIRGSNYGLESKTDKGAYYELNLYKR